MHRTFLLIVTAISEGGTGLLLLVVPSVLFALLLGLEQTSPEAVLVARLAGAALAAMAVTCWLARNERAGPAQLGILTGVLIYDVGAAVLLAYAGLVLSMAGFALWPAVVIHVVLSTWCLLCLPIRKEALKRQ
jgi:hypothetical protein